MGYTETTFNTYSTLREMGAKPAARPKYHSGRMHEATAAAMRTAAYHKSEVFIIPTAYGLQLVWSKSQIPYGLQYRKVECYFSGNSYHATITDHIFDPES